MTSPANRDAVLDVLARFAHGIDGRDWALYRSVFADEIDLDYSSYRPGSAGRMPADAWVDRAKALFPGLDASQHALFNCAVSEQGDEVAVRSSMRAEHFLDGDRYTLGGHYVHRLRREGETWVITALTLSVAWEEGNKALLAAAAGRVPPP